MTTTEKIKARLDEFHLIYHEIHARRAEWKDLQQAEQAQAEYKRETSRFDKELAELAEQKSSLEMELRRRKIQQERGPSAFRPPPPPPVIMKSRPDPGPAPALADKPGAPVASQAARKGARLELQKLVGKYGKLWQLSGEVRGSINRIAEDPARPLGEALALLDWTTFASKIAHRENEEEHLKRLEDWGRALLEYRDWLEGEMDMLRTKYRRVLPIMAVWINRESDDGKKRWRQQISETLAAKESELKTLSDEITRLNTELTQLKAHA